jgi:hypothetical protein
MINLELTTDMAQANIKAFEQRAPAAVARALNRSAISGRAEMVSLIAADMGLKAGVVRGAIRIENASADNLVAKIEARGKRIPIMEFGAKGREPSRGRPPGVRAKSGIGGTQKTYPHAFIATMPGGHRGVFERVPGADRRGGQPHRSQLPIKELTGPSIVHVFRKFRPEGAARAKEALVTNLRSELRHVLRQLTA